MFVKAQRADGDCGVAALATLLGQSYEDVYLVAAEITPRRGKKGLWQKDLIAIAAKLGVQLKRKGKADLDQDEGVLMIRWDVSVNGYGGHFVVLYNGMIIDPAGPQVLPHEEWFRINPKSRPGMLLEEVE